MQSEYLICRWCRKRQFPPARDVHEEGCLKVLRKKVDARLALVTEQEARRLRDQIAFWRSLPGPGWTALEKTVS